MHFHSSSLTFVSASKPSIPVVEFLIWIIETKSAFLPREKTAVLEDKLQSFDKGSTCPLISLLIAQELYGLQFYHAATEIAKRYPIFHISLLYLSYFYMSLNEQWPHERRKLWSEWPYELTSLTKYSFRSLRKQASAGAHHLIALCQKKIYEREVEQSQLDNQIVSTTGDDTQVSPNTPQVLSLEAF